MKALIKNKCTHVCMRVGYYDENGRYHESTTENLELKRLHKSITRNIAKPKFSPV